MQDLETGVRAITERFRGVEGATLPILHAVQAAYGHVPREAVPLIAEALNRTRAEIHGVVSFYGDFRAAPAGRHHVRVCRAEACQSRGGDAVAAAFEAALGLAMGTTSADGRVTLEPVYCLGLCATAPAALVDGAPVGRLDSARVGALVAELAE